MNIIINLLIISFKFYDISYNSINNFLDKNNNTNKCFDEIIASLHHKLDEKFFCDFDRKLAIKNLKIKIF